MITVYNQGDILQQINETCKQVQLSHKNNLNNILNHPNTLAATNKINLYHQKPMMLEKSTGSFIQHASLLLWKWTMNMNVHGIRRYKCSIAYRLNFTFLKILTNPWFCNNDAGQFAKHLQSPHSLHKCKHAFATFYPHLPSLAHNKFCTNYKLRIYNIKK